MIVRSIPRLHVLVDSVCIRCIRVVGVVCSVPSFHVCVTLLFSLFIVRVCSVVPSVLFYVVVVVVPFRFTLRCYSSTFVYDLVPVFTFVCCVTLLFVLRSFTFTLLFVCRLLFVLVVIVPFTVVCYVCVGVVDSTFVYTFVVDLVVCSTLLR